MTAKQYLSQVQYLMSKVRRADERIEYLRTEAEGLKGIRYDKLKVQSSPNPDPIADYIAKLEEAEEKERQLKLSYINTYDTIRKQIYQIEPQLYQQILAHRYLDGWKLERIADHLHYEYGWIRTCHGRALQEFARMHMNEHTKKDIEI